MSFQTGKFEEYRATVKFHMGEREISPGDSVETDGSTVRINGEELATKLPAIRSAIEKAKWLVPIADTTTTT